jgi:FeS assembly protein IscX
MKWTWRDVEELAGVLAARYPDINPLQVDVRELERLVTGLAEFGDDPAASTPSSLEAIQEAWYERFEGG